MIIDRKRYPAFELRKVKRTYSQCSAFRSEDGLALIYTRRNRAHSDQYMIPAKYGGKLATSFNSDVFKDSYPLAFSRITPEQQQRVRAAVLHIMAHGDPIDNDESIFAPQMRR